ncbi:MAG: hypothetical protein ACYTFW_01685 [Planctomycetota bacterium]|jgi:hypothetical protein
MAKNVEDKLNALVARVGKVRRWLVSLAILKVAALCLIFVSVYVCVYAWLDHQFNFGEIGRIIAFILLVAGIVLLLHRLTKLLLSHVSFSGTANYIEGKRNFDQQLVTAIEYYEQKQDYPYSRTLAEQLVLQVEKDSREIKFDTTVEKWKGYALGAIILFGLVVAWFYVRDNYVYFSSYFARLTRPLASVEPLSLTTLESVTKDIITEPDSEVTFAAEIKGRVPEFGKLVLVELEPETTENTKGQKTELMQIRPDFNEQKTPQFEASRSFSQTGQFKYRFETGPASTDWHKLSVCQAPGIKNMMAQVTLPKRPSRRKWAKPYTEQIQNNTLKLIPGSSVTLNVQSTDKLSEVVLTGLDGTPATKQLNGAERFTHSFTADKEGSIKFNFVNEQGLANENIPDLEVIVKADEPPKFKLISPDGDYLATNVASVPITFEVTDDFGLDSIKMCMEIPGQQPKELAITVAEGARSREFTNTVELEEYELTIGDSILFYAEATDIDTGSALANRTSSSDVYFIEVMPYRQNWRSESGGGKGQQTGLPPPVELLNILEYTRAILKKTWNIAGKPDLTEQDRSRIEFINNDIKYCAEQLVLIRDDSQYGFNDAQKIVLNAVLSYYEQASEYLARYNAASAILPEKNAYRVLRKFIIELELELNPPQSGQSPQVQRPDSVKLREQPEFSEYEKERIEGELKKAQQKLEKLTQEQKDLQRTFENYLEQQAEEKKHAQKTTDGKSPTDGTEKQAASQVADKQQSKVPTDQKGKSASAGQSEGESQDGSESQSASKSKSSGEGKSASSSLSDKQNAAKGQGSSPDQSSEEGKSASASRNPGDGKSAAQGRGDAQSQGRGQGNTANAQARLRMLQARQKALQEQVSQLKRDLQQLPEISEPGRNQNRDEAQKHLDEAVAKMNDFQDRLAEARYQADMDRNKSNETVELMESAKSELDLAKEALVGELMLSDEEKLAQKAQEMAEQLAEDADALDESVTPAEREEMLARLEAAKRLLKMMPEPQWTTVDKGGSTPSGASHVLTKNPNLAQAEAARQMARQFWSIAINAKKRQQQLVEEESSDVKFYGQENKFFENAAKFEQKQVQK